MDSGHMGRYRLSGEYGCELQSWGGLCVCLSMEFNFLTSVFKSQAFQY